jgi:fermentation-respiration switch protein FrsA (DUF1100 family)
MFPEYKGTFERFQKAPERGTIADRDLTIEQAKDVRRSIDYLETRPELDTRRLTYYGFSWGASEAVIAAAVEPRFKVAVLASGGLPSRWKPRPEVDPVNFAPRVKISVLMVNGRYDYVLPLGTSQEPLSALRHCCRRQAPRGPGVGARTSPLAILQGSTRLARPLPRHSEIAIYGSPRTGDSTSAAEESRNSLVGRIVETRLYEDWHAETAHLDRCR